MSVSKQGQELRDFTDALRVALGKAPLHRSVRSVYKLEHALPGDVVRSDEWFQAAASNPEENDFSSDRSVERALRNVGSPHRPYGRIVQRKAL